MATKVFEDEYITISPSGTNVVGNPHTFTATVFLNDGDGTGYNPDPGPDGDHDPDRQQRGHGDAGRAVHAHHQCQWPGLRDLHLGDGRRGDRQRQHHPDDFRRRLDHADHGRQRPLDRSVATKVFEDEYITISPSGTNVVGNPHTFTATVFLNDGDGTGYNPDPGRR